MNPQMCRGNPSAVPISFALVHLRRCRNRWGWVGGTFAASAEMTRLLIGILVVAVRIPADAVAIPAHSHLADRRAPDRPPIEVAFDRHASADEQDAAAPTR